MSRFSGKCDFCDSIEIFGIDHILNSKVYVGDNKEPLNLTCLADCVPYFPHIVSLSCHDKATNSAMIRLSEKSWVDMEIERYGEMRMHEIYRDNLKKEMEKAGKEGTSYGFAGS